MEKTTSMSGAPGFNRRRFCAAAAAAVAAGPLGLLDFTKRSEAMATAAQPTGSDGTAIRPFQVNFPEAELAELRRRVNATRWPERETVTDDSQGVRLALLQDLMRYWGTGHDWRKCEENLIFKATFTTEIDGLDIHFLHVRSQHEDALPLIVTHGWP